MLVWDKQTNKQNVNVLDTFGFLKHITSLLQFTVSFQSIIGRLGNEKHAVWEKGQCNFCVGINLYSFTSVYWEGKGMLKYFCKQ